MKKQQHIHQQGFTLIEIMVTAGLVALVFGSVFSVLFLAERMFQQERQALSGDFDVYSYSMRLERVLGAADQVRVLRNFPGFRAISIDHDRQLASETIHLVRGSRLYMINRVLLWNTPPVFRDGDIFLASTDVQDRVVRTEALEGIEYFQTRMVYPEDDLSTVFSSYELRVVRSDTNAPVFIKRFPVGGHQELDTREPYIFQEELPEYDEYSQEVREEDIT